MDSTKLLCLAAAVAAFVAVAGSQGANAAKAHEHMGLHDHMGSCGEYRYWHDGRCVDARDREPGGWPDTMASKKALW
jgi:hypothetical protein